MPSYNNFQNDDIKNSKTQDVFKKRKTMVRDRDIEGERREKIVEWITFYRKNPHRFIEHYFGVTLFPYQRLWVYLMANSNIFVAIASRAAAKSWLIGLYALVRAVLYPNSEVVIVSSTMKQAGLIVSEKITQLRDSYPNIAREIENITSNMNKWEVLLHNGSKIRVVTAGESGRGARSTFTIYEEFRLIDKNVVDAIVKPFAYSRQPAYLKIPEFSSLIEEPKEVYISSAYYKQHWWYSETIKILRMLAKGDPDAGAIFFDYFISVKHGIKTPKQIKKEKATSDPITFSMEYENIPFGSSSKSFFKLKMFNRNINRAFYPQRLDNFNVKKNPYDIKKIDGEIRILSADVAMRAGAKNDNTIMSCTRLLPTSKGYERHVVYLESHNGMNSLIQAVRIKQLFYDFSADYIVLDLAQAGVALYDALGILTSDVERGGIEYPPFTIMEHESIDDRVYEELSRRTLGLNAVPIVYPIVGSAKTNNDISVAMRDILQKKMFSFLVNEDDAETYLMKNSKEFLETKEDFSLRPFFLHPYVQTSLLINECLSLDLVLSSGNIKLVEPSGGRKDRFTSVAYMNYFATHLDKKLIREDEGMDDWDSFFRNTIVF